MTTAITVIEPTEIIVLVHDHFQRIVAMVLDTVSTHSKRAYGRALNDFFNLVCRDQPNDVEQGYHQCAYYRSQS